MGAGRDASLQQLLSHIAQSKPRVSDLSQVPLEIFIFFILCIWLFHHSWIFFYYTGGDTRVRDWSLNLFRLCLHSTKYRRQLFKSKQCLNSFTTPVFQQPLHPYLLFAHLLLACKCALFKEERGHSLVGMR